MYLDAKTGACKVSMEAKYRNVSSGSRPDMELTTVFTTLSALKNEKQAALSNLSCLPQAREYFI